MKSAMKDSLRSSAQNTLRNLNAVKGIHFGYIYAITQVTLIVMHLLFVMKLKVYTLFKFLFFFQLKRMQLSLTYSKCNSRTGTSNILRLFVGPIHLITHLTSNISKRGFHFLNTKNIKKVKYLIKLEYICIEKSRWFKSR